MLGGIILVLVLVFPQGIVGGVAKLYEWMSVRTRKPS
jgi:hypothetical protein